MKKRQDKEYIITDPIGINHTLYPLAIQGARKLLKRRSKDLKKCNDFLYDLRKELANLANVKD